MLVKECMTKNVEVATTDTKLSEVAKLMRDGDFGVIPVKNHDRLVGMITDRDIVIRALSEKTNISQMTVADVMTNKVLYCFEDQTVDEVLDNLGNNQIWRMPVVNREKRLVGILSLCDLVQGDADSQIVEQAINRLGKDKLYGRSQKKTVPEHTYY